MAYGPVSSRVVLFDGLSANSSVYTSNALLVADARQLTVSVVTVGAGASRTTIQGSNDDGLRAAIDNFSVVTTITLQGIYTVDPGARWLRALRSALDSQASVTFQLRS